MNTKKKTPEPPETQKNSQKPGEDEDSKDERGGFKDQGLPEPTRYGDWEVGGRCSDF